jgi:tetratricopeptide (TPR) repeat protein
MFKKIFMRKAAVIPLPAEVQTKWAQAFAFHQEGRLADAKLAYEDILRSSPNHFDALHFLGVIAYQLGDFRTAVELVSKAIAISPDSAAPYSNIGLAQRKLKQLDAAIASFDKAIAIKPDYVEAHYNRGLALQELKRLDAAVASYDKAIALYPGFADAHFRRGNALQELKQLDAAVASYDQAIAINSDFAEAHSNRGNALLDLGQLEAAISSFNMALAIKPDFADAYYNLANAQQRLKQLDAAVASYDQAIAINPDFAEAYCNRGNALQELKQLDAAVASYDQAIAIRPDFARAKLNLAFTLLLGGKLEEGLKLYEWRWDATAVKAPKHNFSQPLWLGTEPIQDKTILLHSEQGLGDTIQFCRYAQLVAGLGAEVILEAPTQLMSLLQGLEGVTTLVERGTPLPAFDYHCPLLSLPLAFKTDIPTIPRGGNYLRYEAKKAAKWAEKLGNSTNTRVGIVWSGNKENANDYKRSVALAQLLSYLPRHCEYFSLQKEVGTLDQATLQANAWLRHFGDELTDFADTAAVCGLMDVVISVDTSVAHLSGALGKPTWILLPYCPDWRWLLDRDDSPWYPSVRLYRQESPFEWDAVLARVRSDLASYLD